MEGRASASSSPQNIQSMRLTEVIAFVNERFAEHPGEARLNHLPTSYDDHRKALDFLSDILTLFGPYEDAMTKESRGLFHSRLASSVNIHRVLPQEVIDVVVQAEVPLNSQEGYLRQMIWREYVHHVHEVTDGFHLLDVNTTTPPNRSAGWKCSWKMIPLLTQIISNKSNRYLWHIGVKHQAWIALTGLLKASWMRHGRIIFLD